MSKLLIHEYPLIVLPSLAKKIGLNEAIVLQQVHFWLENPNTGVIVDGYKWVHNTYEEWRANFPFWSVETVKRTIRSLEESNLLISAQTAPNPFDKTKSYRVNYDLLDEVNLTPSITEITVSDTNNTANDEKPVVATTLSEPKRTYSPLKVEDLPLEWQIGAGADKVVVRDQKETQMVDAANLIATGTGSKRQLVYNIALAFMQTRNILIPAEKAKAQRKPITEMIGMGVTPEHVVLATQKLMDAGMTVVDLYAISKTAIDLANSTPKDWQSERTSSLDIQEG